MIVTVLEAQAVTKSFGRRQVLRPVSLTLDSNTYYALLGPNGAGKTTLLSILTGLTDASSGTVTILGKSLDNDIETRLNIGFSPDDAPMPDSLTGREFLQLHNRLRRRHDMERCIDLTNLFQIHSALDQQIFEYSHGMRRKLQFVAAVAHEPDLLVLDEPFRGLDPRSAFILRTFLRKYADSGRTVLVATHDMLRAEKDADRLILLDGGAVRAEGTCAELFTAADGASSLEDAFDRLTVDPIVGARTTDLIANLVT